MEKYRQILSEDFPNILFVKGEQNARYPHSHSLILGDFIIDTGASTKRLKKIRKDYVIKNVILSHWHEDHIHANHLFKDAQFLCHSLDKPIIEDVSKMIHYYDVEGTPIGNDLLKLLEYLRCENTQITKLIKDNDLIRIDENLELRVLFTPGHTAGHCAFLETNSNIGFFGDIDLAKLPYYGNIDANLIQFEESIDRLASIDFDVVLTGHKGPFFGTQLIKEELSKYKVILKKRDDEILSYFKETSKVVLEDLKNKHIIYKKYMFEDFEIIAERIMIQKHIDKFLEHGILAPKENGYILN